MGFGWGRWSRVRTMSFQGFRCRSTSLILFSVVLSCAAQESASYVVLPASQAESVTRLCSRIGPEHVAGGWNPSTGDIQKLEATLDRVSAMRPTGAVSVPIQSPRNSFRQYVGIRVGERNLIYVNAFPRDYVPSYRRSKLVNVCDGGAAFWGVTFDPATGDFTNLFTNGVG